MSYDHGLLKNVLYFDKFSFTKCSLTHEEVINIHDSSDNKLVSTKCGFHASIMNYCTCKEVPRSTRILMTFSAIKDDRNFDRKPAPVAAKHE